MATEQIRVKLPDPLTSTINAISENLASVEAPPSVGGLPAGAASGGYNFEHAVTNSWSELLKALKRSGYQVSACQVSGAKRHNAWVTSVSCPSHSRYIYLDGHPSQKFKITNYSTQSAQIPEEWVQRQFMIKDLIKQHLGEKFLHFAPQDNQDSPDYFKDKYAEMFEGKTTTFDFVAACVDNGILQEKLLFEYKSAKSSKGVSVDGNAHERLSFQTLQYLEVAAMNAKTSFNVIASSAFSRYKNKYHVCFNQHSVRLGDAFPYFTMRFIANRSEYRCFFTMLAGWLVCGKPLVKDYRTVLLVS